MNLEDKIKERNEKYKQRTIQDYYESLVQKSDGFTKIKSKRLALAIADLKGEDFDASIVFPNKRPGAKKAMRSETKKTTAADDKEEEVDEAVTEAVPSPLKLPDAPPKKEKKTPSRSPSESIHSVIQVCLLYTTDAAHEGLGVELGGLRIIKKK